MPAPDDFFSNRFGPSHIADEVGQQAAQVKAAVEPVGKGGQVALGVLAVLQRLEGARQRGLEVSEHGVDPLELWQVPRLERAHHLGHVDAARFGNRSKAPQAIAGDDGLGHQAGLGPLGDDLGGEAADQVELEVDGLARVVQGDRRHEGHFVLRATTRLAPGALAPEVGIIQLHGPAQQSLSLLGGHGVVDLVVQQPGRGVAHPQIPLERQRGDAGLGLADEVNGQEPGRQRQLGVLHQGACRQRGLMPARPALKQLAGAVTHHVVMVTGAARAAEAIGPARAVDRLGALRLGAEAAQKFRNRHAALELDLVAGHRSPPSSGKLRVRGHLIMGRAC